MDAIERKVASLTALNGVLRSENADLRQRLAEADNGRGEEDEELADLQAEFATRIGQADKQLAELRVRPPCFAPQATAALVLPWQHCAPRSATGVVLRRCLMQAA